MSQIIIQPTGSKDAQSHFNDTIKNSVNLSKIKHLLRPEDIRTLQDIYPSDKSFIWGAMNSGSNHKKWSKIESGDVVLFSKQGSFYASAVVTHKTLNKSLAHALWGDDKTGKTWELVYFLSEVRVQRIPYTDFNKVVGYKSNFIPQGFSVLSDDKSEAVLRAYNLSSETFFAPVSGTEYIKSIDQLNELIETDREIKTLQRKEQSYLRRHLFGNKTTARCGLCGNLFPTSFLVAAHIKKRSHCTLEERTDPNVVMPLCKFGCDELFEQGYVSINKGVITPLNRIPTPIIHTYIAKLEQKTCSFYNPESKKFFEWHHKAHSNAES